MKCKNSYYIKKEIFFENRLSDSIGKLKNLWEALKSLGLPNENTQ